MTAPIPAPTNNPLGSTDARDNLFNASNLDKAMNSTEDTFTDRFGVARKTWTWISTQFSSILNVFKGDLANETDIAKGAALVGLPWGETVYDNVKNIVFVTRYKSLVVGGNWTPAFQAAVDYLKSIGGGELVCPKALYRLDGNVIIAGNFGFAGITVRGNKSIIQTTFNGAAFIIDAYDTGGASSAEGYRINAQVDGFDIYGPGIASALSVGILARYSANVTVSDCAIRNFYTGLQGRGVLLSHFDDLRIFGNHTGIDFAYSLTPVSFGCNDNHFNRCMVYDNVKALFYSSGSGADTTFNGCEIEGNNLASTGITDGVKCIEFYLCGKITFFGGYIEDNRGQYNISYSSADATGALNFFGTQFLLSGATGYGIYLDNTVGTASSLTMTGGSIGMTTNADIYIGTGFAVTLNNVKVAGQVLGDLSKLVTINNGRIAVGANGSPTAGMRVNGSAYSGFAFDFNGMMRMTDDLSTTRYGYLTGSATTVGLISDGGSVQVGNNSGTARIVIGRAGAMVEPNSDNTHTLGSATYRWSVVYAGTGTINTSDERLKKFFEVNDPERLAAKELRSMLPMKYKFNDSIAEKGEGGARIHFGAGAQTVASVFEKHGLVPANYALFCYDEWEAVPEERNEDGDIVRAFVPAGNRFGLRYEELVMFMLLGEK